MNEVMKTCANENLLSLNETLLAIKSCTPRHHLCAIELDYNLVSRIRRELRQKASAAKVPAAV
jgi:hypothetical protein